MKIALSEWFERGCFNRNGQRLPAMITGMDWLGCYSKNWSIFSFTLESTFL